MNKNDSHIGDPCNKCSIAHDVLPDPCSGSTPREIPADVLASITEKAEEDGFAYVRDDEWRHHTHSLRAIVAEAYTHALVRERTAQWHREQELRERFSDEGIKRIALDMYPVDSFSPGPDIAKTDVNHNSRGMATNALRHVRDHILKLNQPCQKPS